MQMYDGLDEMPTQLMSVLRILTQRGPPELTIVHCRRATGPQMALEAIGLLRLPLTGSQQSARVPLSQRRG
jgi:hypothetical protein